MKLRQIIIIENDQHLDYTGINTEIKDKLEKYKSHFQQWGIQEIRKGEHPESVIDAIEYYQSKIKDNRFQEILGKLTPSPKNILTLDLDQIKTAQAQYDEKYSRTSKRELRKQLKQNYVEILLDTPQWKIIKIEKTDGTDGAAKILAEYARGTKWCVTDPKTGDHYLNQGPLYVIFKSGVKSALCHIQSRQLMNTSDVQIRLGKNSYEFLSPYIPKLGIFADKKSNAYRETIKEIPELAYDYALRIIRGRWPEAEPYIMRDPVAAFYYAQDIIKGRWPEAEPIIMKDPQWSASYIRYVIEGK